MFAGAEAAAAAASRCNRRYSKEVGRLRVRRWLRQTVSYYSPTKHMKMMLGGAG